MGSPSEQFDIGLGAIQGDRQNRRIPPAFVTPIDRSQERGSGGPDCRGFRRRIPMPAFHAGLELRLCRDHGDRMVSPAIKAVALLVAGIGVALFLFDRLMLWMESRGWVVRATAKPFAAPSRTQRTCAEEQNRKNGMKGDRE